MGNKKSASNPMDDEFTKMSDEVGQGGDMAQYSDYQKFDVSEKVTKLEKSAKELIVSICKLYASKLELSNDEYLKAVAETEQANLVVLLKQVKYSEHILDSLMRQLDAGGYMDSGIYGTIREMQKSAIGITLEVSRYMRTLPEYFKFIAKDSKVIENETMQILGKATQNIGSNSEQAQLPESTSNDAYNLSGPLRGTRELMMQIADSRQALTKALETAEEADATPISIDDDGELDEYEEVDDNWEEEELEDFEEIDEDED